MGIQKSMSKQSSIVDRWLDEGSQVALVDKMVKNGGPGSGNFGHAGRPGKVGGSAPTGSGKVYSEARTKSFMIGDTIKITHEGQEYEGVLKGVSNKTTDIKVKVGDREISIPVRLATIVDKEGKEIELPFRGVKMVKNVDAPDTTPAERRTEKQKKALDDVSKLIKVNDRELDYLKKNCSEDTAVALKDVLNEAKEAGINLADVELKHNNRLSRAEARVTYGTTARGSKLPAMTLELGSKIIADGEWYKNRQKEAYKEGWHPTDDIAGLIRHEIGHIKTGQMVIDNWRMGSDTSILQSYRIGWMLDSLCSQVIRQAGYSRLSVSHGAGEDVSDYAITNDKELIAEAYANPDFSKVTRAIVDELDRQFRQENGLSIKVENRAKKEEVELCSGYPLTKEDWEVMNGKKPKEYIPEDME